MKKCLLIITLLLTGASSKAFKVEVFSQNPARRIETFDDPDYHTTIRDLKHHMAIKEGYQEDAFDNVDLTLARQPLRNDAQARSEMERVLGEMGIPININTNTTIRLNLQISISLKVKGAGRLGQEPLGPTFTHYERNAGAGAGAAQPPEEREISSETSASAEHEISSDTSESAEEDEVQAEASRNRGNPITRFFRRLFGR